VLYYILDNRFGGPNRLAHATARRLRARGVETVFLLGYKAGQAWTPDGFQAYSLTNIQLCQRRRPLLNLLRFCCWLPLNLARMRRIIRSERIDVVRVDGVTNFVPALAAAVTRTPIVWHYNDHPPRLLRGALMPLAGALSAAVTVQGEKLRDSRTAAGSRLREKTVVVYPGVDLSEFDPSGRDAGTRAGLRKELGIPPDCPLVGAVGNLNRFKGHTYFIRAARQIKERLPDARFIVVGRELDTDRAYWEQLQRLTVECGLERDVVYTGFRRDIPAILSIMDVFVLASVLESCPNVLLEAMAMRVPVVATDVGAVTELVTDGCTGLVAPPHDAGAIARAVVTILSGPRSRAIAMAEAARKTVETRFAIDTIAEQQQRIYETVMRQRTRHA